MEIFLLIVSNAGGAVTIGTLFVKVSKVIEALNKKCPCLAVYELQEKTDRHAEYFSNDHEAIGKLSVSDLETKYKFKNINDKVNRIDEGVKRLLNR